MTISYNGDISSSSSFSFLRVILRWKGSIWKAVIVELIVWIIMYYLCFVIYRELMSEEQRRWFVKFAQYTDITIDYLPLTFMLGFFVSIVVDRWKNIFSNIGFIDNVAIFCTAVFRGTDEESLNERRNTLRYLCLTQVLVLRDISMQVRKRFPTIDSIVDAGFLMPHEKELLIEVTDKYNRHWVPMHWALALVVKARRELKIAGDAQMNGLIKEMLNFRASLQVLCNYDWVPVPLAYPQVVFMAVRMYFLLSLISRQFLFPGDSVNRSIYNIIDLKVPMMTLLQFVFYMGWMKVAEALLNPLGEDDDDLECSYIIDKNATIAMTLADQCHQNLPEQRRDRFAFGGYRALYSEESANIPIHPLVGSAKAAMPDQMLDAPVKMVPHADTTTDADARSTSSSDGSAAGGKRDSLRQQLRKRLSKKVSDSNGKLTDTYRRFDAPSHIVIPDSAKTANTATQITPPPNSVPTPLPRPARPLPSPQSLSFARLSEELGLKRL